MRYAATASLLAALATATPALRTVYLAPDGTVLTSATGAIRLLLVGPDNEVLKVIAMPTATPTPKPCYRGDDLSQCHGQIFGLTREEIAAQIKPPTPTATPKMDCPAGFVCMTNNTDVDMRVTLDVGPTPTATATAKEK